MRTLKGCFVMFALFAIGAGILLPATWLYVAASLPNQLDGQLDIETHLRQSIESERHSMQLNRRVKDRESVKWDRPDFTRLPKHLVALYITETGCPTYFQSQREDGAAWTKRVLYSVLDKQLDGDGACELIFARRLARRLGAKTNMQVAVASDRVHRFLQKDELVAFDLHSMQFEQGVIGVEAASKLLMQKELTQLSLSELAEFQLAIPPWDIWEDVKQCKNVSLVRQSRDKLLTRLAWAGLISDEMAKTGAAQPVRCLSVQR